MIHTGVTGNPGDVSVDLTTGIMYVADGFGNWVAIETFVAGHTHVTQGNDNQEITMERPLSEKLEDLEPWHFLLDETKADLIANARRLETAAGHATMLYRNNVVRLVSGADGIEVWVGGVKKMVIL